MEMLKTNTAHILLNSINRLLNSNAILTAIGTLLILHVGSNGAQFVNSSTLPTPYPDPNARVPTITSKLENLSELHRTPIRPVSNSATNSPSATTTEGYLNLNGNDSYGKSIIWKQKKPKKKIVTKKPFSLVIGTNVKYYWSNFYYTPR